MSCNGHKGTVGIGLALIGSGRGRVFQIAVAATARVYLILGDNVGSGVAPGLAHFEQVVVVANDVGVAHDAIGKGIGDPDAGERLVAGVPYLDSVGNTFARHIGHLAAWVEGLGDVQGRVPPNRHRGTVGIGLALIGVGRGRILQIAIAVAIRVYFCLGDNVGSGVAPGLAHFEKVVVVAGDVGVAHDAIGKGIGDRDAGQRLVTGVLYRDSVGNAFACHISHLAWISILGNYQGRVLVDGHRGIVGIGLTLIGVSRGHVIHVAGIDVILGHSIGAGIDPGLINVEFVVQVGITRNVGDTGNLGICDRHIGQAHVPYVGHGEGIGYQLAGIGIAISPGIKGPALVDLDSRVLVGRDGLGVLVCNFRFTEESRAGGSIIYLTRIQVSLCDGIGIGPGPGLAGIKDTFTIIARSRALKKRYRILPAGGSGVSPDYKSSPRFGD